MHTETKEELSLHRVGTAIVVHNPIKNTVILGVRLNSYQAGKFGLPGGRIEKTDASLYDGAIRELQEETKLTGQLIPCGIVYDHTDGSLFTHHVFVLQTEQQATLAEPTKCKAWNEYPLTELPKTILSAHQEAIVCFQEWEKSQQVTERNI